MVLGQLVSLVYGRNIGLTSALLVGQIPTTRPRRAPPVAVTKPCARVERPNYSFDRLGGRRMRATGGVLASLAGIHERHAAATLAFHLVVCDRGESRCVCPTGLGQEGLPLSCV